VRIRGYLSKSRGSLKQERLGNTGRGNRERHGRSKPRSSLHDRLHGLQVQIKPQCRRDLRPGGAPGANAWTNLRNLRQTVHTNTLQCTYTHTHIYTGHFNFYPTCSPQRVWSTYEHNTHTTKCNTDARRRTAVSVATRNKSGNFVLCSEAAQPTSNHKVSGVTAAALPRYKTMTTTCVPQNKTHSNDNRKKKTV